MNDDGLNLTYDLWGVLVRRGSGCRPTPERRMKMTREDLLVVEGGAEPEPEEWERNLPAFTDYVVGCPPEYEYWVPRIGYAVAGLIVLYFVAVWLRWIP